MNFFTDGLVKKKPEFSLRIGRKLKYYLARSLDRKRTIMWMEQKHSGRMYSYPCLIMEPDRLYHFSNKSFDRDYLSKNEILVKRWKEVVSPETLYDGYEVEELEEMEFNNKYRKLRDGGRLDVTETGKRVDKDSETNCIDTDSLGADIGTDTE